MSARRPLPSDSSCLTPQQISPFSHVSPAQQAASYRLAGGEFSLAVDLITRTGVIYTLPVGDDGLVEGGSSVNEGSDFMELLELQGNLKMVTKSELLDLVRKRGHH